MFGTAQYYLHPAFLSSENLGLGLVFYAVVPCRFKLEMSGTVFYIGDPMCSWCWGFGPALAAVEAGLPAEVPMRYVMGGLAPDSDEPMAPEVRAYVQENWRAVEAGTGASFNWDFWERCLPRRSTYPACRAVLAAQLQDAGPAMFRAVQRAYYTEARNPSDLETLTSLAAELGLDAARFERDFASPEVEALLQRDFETRRRLGVREFPTLLIESPAGSGKKVLLARGWAEPRAVLAALRRALGAAAD